MKDFPDNCIDSIVTDPPYAFGFMGKAWDKFPSDEGSKKPFANQSKEQKLGGFSFQKFTKQWATESLRILKPGGHLLSFGGTRTYHRMVCGIEDAGFEIRDCLQWLYGCLSEDTEILTINGWELYHKNIVNSPVLCYLCSEDKFIFAKPTKSYFYANKHTAYRIQSDHTDQIVSRNHRCIIERNGRKIFKYAEELETKENIPFLESLSDLPETIYDFQSHTSIKKQDLLKRMSEKDLLISEKTRNKILNNIKLSDLWKGISNKEKQTRKILFMSLRRQSKRLAQRIFKQWQGEITTWDWIKWRQKSSMERWSNLFQKKRQLFTDKICQMSNRIFGNGSERWLYYGTSVNNGSIIGQMFTKNRGGTSYQSRSTRQSNRKFNVIQNESETQIVRSTKATIIPVKYIGNVWCIEVPTGAFVARRNGKIFVTGNSGFPKNLDIGKQIDKMKGAEREIIGKYPNPAGSKGNTFPLEQECDLTIPATPEAKQWDGWGTSLKPAIEMIVLARKPISEKNIAENVMKWGTGGIAIDKCRIEGQKRSPEFKNPKSKGMFHQVDPIIDWDNSKGRWPANVIFDEEAAGLLDEQEGFSSRFFYIAKSSKSERNAGLEGFKKKIGGMRSETSGQHITRRDGGDPKPVKNNHPTVKPIKLMRYLVRLVTPPGGVCLDPFIGSGTTAIACVEEEFDYIGIEKEKEYFNITKARVKNAKQQKELETERLRKRPKPFFKESELQSENPRLNKFF